MLPKTVILVALLTGVLLASSAHADGYYFTVTPPDLSDPLIVGPYNSGRGCGDWLGSAINRYPRACHHNPAKCVPIGVGYAYPGTPSEGCTSKPGTPAFANTYSFFFYPASGGGQIVGGTHRYRKCQHLRKKYAAGRFGAGEVGNNCFWQGNTFE